MRSISYCGRKDIGRIRLSHSAVRITGEMLLCWMTMGRKFLGLKVTSTSPLCIRSDIPGGFIEFVPLSRYFGRAKDLPGVRELFQSKKKEEDEQNQVHEYYKKFTNQGPAYFGDLDEQDGKLLEYERAAEEEGTSSSFPLKPSSNDSSGLTCRMGRRTQTHTNCPGPPGRHTNTPTPPALPKRRTPHNRLFNQHNR